MEPLGRTLRNVLGRARYGLFAIIEEGAAPVLVDAGPDGPPTGLDPTAVLEREGELRPLPAGELRFVQGRRPVRSVRPARRRAAVLPVGEGEALRGALLIEAGPRARFWDWGREDWTTLAGYLDAHLRHEQLRGAFASLQGFHEVLLANLPLGVFAIDELGRVTFISPPAEAILGYSREEAVGADCLRIFRPSGVEENPLLLGLQGKASIVDLYISDRHGREKPVWMQMARIPGRPGEKPRGLIAMIRDISEDRAFEEEQRRRERLASIGELSAGVAHEIRNPLTGIGNCAQVIRDRLLPDDPRRRFVQIILDETARLNRIVESLLSFARPGKPHLEECQIVETIQKAVELEQAACAEQGITPEVTARGRIPKIYIDPEQISQVLLNVIRNAIEAMPSGGRLTIECCVIRRKPHLRKGTGQRKTDRIRYDQSVPVRRFVQIRIADSGRGVPRDVVPRVFDPFFTTRAKGTGLGLSISQSIVREHGGFLSLRSIENKGTTISIDLPVERRIAERRRKER